MINALHEQVDGALNVSTKLTKTKKQRPRKSSSKHSEFLDVGFDRCQGHFLRPSTVKAKGLGMRLNKTKITIATM